MKRENLWVEGHSQLLLTQRDRWELWAWWWVAFVAGVLNVALVVFIARTILEG